MEMAFRTPMDFRAKAAVWSPLTRRGFANGCRWLAACLVAVLAMASVPQAAIGQTWTGGGTSGSWSDSANWTSLPLSSANLYFGGNTNTNTVNNLRSSVARFYFTNDGSAGKTAAFTITGNAVAVAVGDATLFNTTAITTGGPITDEIALDIVGGLSSIGGASLGANHNLKLSGKLGVGGINAGIGAGTLIVTNTANTWTGLTSIAGSRVEVTQLLAGVANASGTSSAITIGQFGNTGTLVYIGAGETATKRFTFGNGTSGGSHTGGSNLLNNGSGAITFNSGTFNIADNTAAWRTLTLGGTSSFSAEIQGSIINNGTTGGAALSITKANSGTWILSGSNTYTGATSVSNGTLQLGNNGTTGWIGSSSSVILGATSANLVFARTDDYGGNFTRVISGTGNIRLASGTLTLSATNTVGGTTRVDGVARLILTSTATLQNSAFDTAGAGTLVLAGATPVLGGLAGSTNLASGNISGYSSVTSLTLNPSTGLSNTYSGAITDGVAGMTLAKTGNGTQVLSGSNSYTGGTTLSAGRLDLNNGNALGSGAVTISSGTLGNSLGSSVALATNNAFTLGGNFSFAGPNDLDLGTGAVTMAATRIATVDAGRLTIGGAIASTSAGLTKSGSGTLRLTGANAYTGVTTVSGGVLEYNSIANSGTASALGAPAAGANSIIALSNDATLRYTGTGGHSSNRTINLNTASTGTATLEAMGSGSVALGSVTAVNNASKVLVLGGSNTLSNSIGAIIEPSSGGATSLVKTGPGRWVLSSGTSSFSGGVQVQQGELVLGASVINSAPGASAIGASGTVAIGSNTNPGIAAFLLGENITFSSRNISVSGSATQVAILGSTGTSGTATFSSTGTPSIFLARDVTLQAASGGTVEFQNRWFDSSGTSAPSANVTIGSAGNLGTVVLRSTAANSGTLGTTGTISVNYGTLQVVAAGLLPSTSAINVNGATFQAIDYNPLAPLMVGSTGSATISGTGLSISGAVTNANTGSSALTFSGTTGTITLDGGLSGAGSTLFSGGASISGTVSQGTVRIDGVGTLGTLSGGTLGLNGATASITTLNGGRVNLANNVALSVANGAFADAITGAGSLTKTGVGKLTLSGSNSYSGATSIAAGTLAVDGSIASAVTVASGAILGGSGRITSNIGGDGLIAPGNSPGILQVDGQVIPTESTAFAFEFTQAGDPTWSNAAASGNDVLRLTGTAPFQSPLTATNTVNVYFDVASLASGDIFRGGFYSDKTSGQLNFAAAIGAPTYEFYVYGSGSGATTYNGKNYYTLAQYMAANPSVTGITTSVVTVPTANYANGTVTNGQVTQFVVVPEPATLALAAVGIGLGGWAAVRRRKT